MALLSLQSHVVYGHVGNSAAVFPLQRLGVEVWPVHTVQFANHAGYGPPRGAVLAPALIADLVTGLRERDALKSCGGVISGYVGSAAVGGAILDAVAAARTDNPDCLYCCDPVLGDDDALYVSDEIAMFFRDRAVPGADVVTPNGFELGWLTGRPVQTLADAVAAMQMLRRAGPRVVLATAVGKPPGHIDVLACDAEGCWRVRTPRLPVSVNGAGDMLSALFFAHYLRSRSAPEAMSRAVSSVFGVVARTAALGRSELALVAAQDEIATPSRLFPAAPLAA